MNWSIYTNNILCEETVSEIDEQNPQMLISQYYVVTHFEFWHCRGSDNGLQFRVKKMLNKENEILYMDKGSKQRVRNTAI